MTPGISLAEQELARALLWLRAHLPASANLHADSRAIQAGDVFLAYAVEGADGRPYIQNALQRGAGAILYQPSEEEDGAASDANLALETGHPINSNSTSITDNNTAANSVISTPRLSVAHLAALAGPLASAWYGAPSDALYVVGITGTNGKTSCSHWIAQAFGTLDTPCAVIGTLGSGMPGALVPTGFTTPDAPQLQRCLMQVRQAGAQAVAIEASSHALVQERLKGTAFDVAIFTNLSRDHLDYHQTPEAYETAKNRLFDWPGLRCAIINQDDAAGQRLLERVCEKVRTIAYSIDEQMQKPMSGEFLQAKAIRVSATGTSFQVESSWGKGAAEISAPGAFNVSNALAVLGALLVADVPFEQALAHLAQLTSVPGRMQRMGGRLHADEPLIVIDYAHTPDALEKALTELRSVTQQRGGALICLFGCGGNRDAGKRPLMGEIAQRLADQVILTSDNPRYESPAAIIDEIAGGMTGNETAARCIEDRASAILQTIRGAAAKDVILLAGKGHEATQEIEGKKRPFSDQEHTRLALTARAARNVLGMAKKRSD